MYEQKIADLDQRVERIEGAFPQDGQGKPRFYDCRQFLTKELKDDELISDIKDKAIKQIAYWALGLLLTAVALYLKFTGLLA